MNKITKATKIRVCANIVLLAGQYIILYEDINLGIVIKLLGSAVLVYSLYEYKMWDVIVTLTAFTILELSKLFS